MKCCVSTDVGTWTNWLTFEPDLDYSPDAGTGLLSPISYKRCNAEFYYVGKIPRIHIGRPSLQRGVVLKWFYSRRAIPPTKVFRYGPYRNTFVGGTCALPSAILVGNGTIRKLWVRFLFAFYSNDGPVLYHFRDKARYCSKIANISYPLHSTPPL